MGSKVRTISIKNIHKCTDLQGMNLTPLASGTQNWRPGGERSAEDIHIDLVFRDVILLLQPAGVWTTSSR